jgi:hypothetical protein
MSGAPHAIWLFEREMEGGKSDCFDGASKIYDSIDTFCGYVDDIGMASEEHFSRV